MKNDKGTKVAKTAKATKKAKAAKVEKSLQLHLYPLRRSGGHHRNESDYSQLASASHDLPVRNPESH